MKKKIEYFLHLPFQIQGDKFYFWAENEFDAREKIGDLIQCVQDSCQHDRFLDGKCTACHWECEHDFDSYGQCEKCGINNEEDDGYSSWKERNL